MSDPIPATQGSLTTQGVRPAGRLALRSLNFFMADMQAGVGPFLGVFLLAHGWQSGWIGSVMTLGGVAGMLMTAPAGAWVDGSIHKRWLVVVPGVFTVLASAVILVSQSFWPVALSQVATAIAGAAIAPAVTGITLGMYGQSGFNRQIAINQAHNHAGNAIGAGLSGLLGWRFGMPAVFWLAVAFALASIVSVLAIPPASINDRAARGLQTQGPSDERAQALSVLFETRALLVLAAALALFHLGNAAMLPLYGLAVGSGGPHSQWHRTGQCGSGRGHDHAGDWSLSESGDRWLAGTMARLWVGIRSARTVCRRIAHPVDHVRRHGARGL